MFCFGDENVSHLLFTFYTYVLLLLRFFPNLKKKNIETKKEEEGGCKIQIKRGANFTPFYESSLTLSNNLSYLPKKKGNNLSDDRKGA